MVFGFTALGGYTDEANTSSLHPDDALVSGMLQTADLGHI